MSNIDLGLRDPTGELKLPTEEVFGLSAADTAGYFDLPDGNLVQEWGVDQAGENCIDGAGERIVKGGAAEGAAGGTDGGMERVSQETQRSEEWSDGGGK